MTENASFLHVKGAEIEDGNAQVIRLRGVCLGGWMNMENFIIGYPGHESGIRAAVARVLGEARARFFFERFLHHFVTEDDLRFLKSIGCNVVRVPFNYRHFESDDRPFEYKPEGFALLDRVIDWARTHQVYVILDLHAAQGCQSRGWHCDNPGREAHLWGQKGFEDRVIALWEALARRYRDEPVVAGYNIVNEPEAGEVQYLNRLYRRATEAIRAIDTNHILFLEGNHYSQQFEQLDPPFDDNTVYSSHYYFAPCVDEGEYPGTFSGEKYDRARLAALYAERTAWIRQHGVPHWFGEFGCIYSDAVSEPSHLRVMADIIDIVESHGDHWTLWTYKDIGKMGLLIVDPESEWMRRTQPVRAVKTALRCDSWIERHETLVADLTTQIADHSSGVMVDLPGDGTGLEESLQFAVCDGVLSRALQPAFAEQFRGMSESDIDQMMQSFAYGNCIQRDGLIQIMRARCRNGV